MSYNIKIEVNVSETIKGLKNYKELIKKAIAKTLHQEGVNSVRYARSIAPNGYTGKLSAGIYFQANQNKLKVISGVPGNFPYNKWVDQYPGWAILGPYKKPNARFGIKVGDHLVYGRSLPSWNWSKGGSGVRYMYKTSIRLKSTINDTLNKNLSKLTGI